MNGLFYYRSGQQQLGPVSRDELVQLVRAGRVPPGELVWTQGMPSWQPASQVPGLLALPVPAAVPPPPPAMPTTLPQHPPAAAPAPVPGPPPPPAAVHPPVPARPALATQPAAPAQPPGPGFVQRASDELRRTLEACVAQIKRLFSLGRTSVDARRQAAQALAAKERLGERMHEAGQGDPALREQLVQLVERRKSVEAVKGPTKLLDAERRGLYIRLADTVMSGPAPKGVEMEHAAAVSLAAEVAALGQQQGAQTRSLLPTDQKDRLRLAIAAGTLLLVLFVGLPLAWAVGKRALRLVSWARSPGVVEQPADEPVEPAPVETPVESDAPIVPVKPTQPKPPPKNAKPRTEERWVDEDQYFPRRKVIVTLVGDQAHGECKCYDDNDRLIAVEHYKNGVLHGKRQTYFPSGKKFGELNFENGQANGTATTWFENGNKSSSIDFVKGEIHGKSITYFSNGNKSVESTLVHGVAQGERYHYKPNGTHFGTSYWTNDQQTGQTIHEDVGLSDYQQIEERANYSIVLKDHWR